MSGWISDDDETGEMVDAALHRARQAALSLISPRSTATSIASGGWDSDAEIVAIDDDDDAMEIDHLPMRLDAHLQLAVEVEMKRIREQSLPRPVISVGNLAPRVDPHRDQAQFRLVVDTNLLLSHIRWLATVKDAMFQHGIVLLIPTIVLRELDSLKTNESVRNQADGTSGLSIGILARHAIRQLHRWLHDGDPAVHGQMMTQVLDPAKFPRAATNDDEIMQCCVWFMINGSRVALLSDDANLCVKVMIHQVPSLSSSNPMLSQLDPHHLINHLYSVTNHQESDRISMYD